MTKSSKAKLAYQAKYNNTPEQVERQTKRKAAWREALKTGAKTKGDGKDVVHKTALDNGGGNGKGNVAVGDASENRGWRKGRKGYSVPNK